MHVARTARDASSIRPPCASFSAASPWPMLRQPHFPYPRHWHPLPHSHPSAHHIAWNTFFLPVSTLRCQVSIPVRLFFSIPSMKPQVSHELYTRHAQLRKSLIQYSRQSAFSVRGLAKTDQLRKRTSFYSNIIPKPVLSYVTFLTLVNIVRSTFANPAPKKPLSDNSPSTFLLRVIDCALHLPRMATVDDNVTFALFVYFFTSYSLSRLHNANFDTHTRLQNNIFLSSTIPFH